MNKVKMTKKKTRRLVGNRSALGIIFSLLAIFILGFLAQQKYQEHQQRQKFIKLEQALAEFSQKVEQTFGEPVQQETKAFCEREGVKYSKGRIFCGVRSGGNFLSNSVDEAKTKGEKVRELILADTNFHNLSAKNEIDRPGEWFHDFAVRVLEDSLTCSLTLSFKDQNQSSIIGPPGDPKPGTFGFLIRCTEFASK
jgi:hypothetical protein